MALRHAHQHFVGRRFGPHARDHLVHGPGQVAQPRLKGSTRSIRANEQILQRLHLLTHVIQNHRRAGHVAALTVRGGKADASDGREPFFQLAEEPILSMRGKEFKHPNHK